MVSETTYKAKKIVLLIKLASIIMVVGNFQGGYPLVPPPLNKSLSMTLNINKVHNIVIVHACTLVQSILHALSLPR